MYLYLYSRTCILFAASIFICSLFVTSAQEILINEIVSRNSRSLYDNHYNTPDWIELYNNTDKPINLKDYRISDRNNYAEAWVLPDTVILPKSFLVVYASGADTVVSNTFTIESSGRSIYHYSIIDSYRFDYLLVEGDFEISVSVTCVYPIENRAPHGGILAKEELDSISPFVALNYMNSQDYLWHWFNNRSTPFTYPSYHFPEYNNVNNTANLKMIRLGDSVYAYFLDADGAVLKVHTVYFPKKEIYIGLATANTDENQLTRFSFKNLKVNGEHFNFNDLKAAEINTTIAGRKYASREMHTDFQLSSEGESVYLWDNIGNMIHSVDFPYFQTDVSYAAVPDGSNNYMFLKTSTPCNSNNTQPYLGILDEPNFSIEGGWFDSPQYVTIQSNEQSAKIFYTVDGSEPTEFSSEYNTEIIEINENTVLRAIAFKDNYLPSNVHTKSFFINDSSYLPVISISANPEELNNSDSNGLFDAIFSNKRIKSNIEYFDSSKNVLFDSPLEMRLVGHGAARGWGQPSMRFDSRGVLGSKSIHTKFFGENSLPEYKTIKLRNSSGDWTHTFCRDVFVSMLSKKMPSQIISHYQPVLSFINGEFFGLYNLREHTNESYISAKYGIPKDSVNILRNFEEVTAGSAGSFFFFVDEFMKSESNIPQTREFIEQNLDIDNILDYTVISLFVSNFDWPYNNIIQWKSNVYDGKWRFISNDFDWSYAWDNYVTHPENDCIFRFFDKKDEPEYLFSKIISKILEDNYYRNIFLNKAADMINSIFREDNLVTLLDSVLSIIKPVKDRQQALRSDCMIYFDGSYNIMLDFAQRRHSYFCEHLVEQFSLSGLSRFKLSSNLKDNIKFRINSIYSDSSEFDGIYFKDIPIEIEVISSDYAKFIGWSDSELPVSKTLSLILSDSLELTALFEVSSLTPILVTEIMYKPDSNQDCRDWFELFNPNDDAINMSGYVFKDDNDKHIFIFPEGTHIEPHSYLIVSQDPDTFAKFFTDDLNVIGPFDFGIGTTDQIRIFDSFGFLIDTVSYTSSAPWPTGADGTGYSIELIDYTFDNNIGQNWIVSAQLMGNPGKGYVSVSDAEIHPIRLYPNPADKILFIDAGVSPNDLCEISIFDALGRTRKKATINDNHNGLIRTSISIEDLEIGVYYLKIKQNGINRIEKIVIHR